MARWDQKPFTDAVRKALLAPADARGKRQVDKLAEQLVRAAVNGDIQAAKLVVERVEGKPDQKRITEHELSISQQMLEALRSVSNAPKARLIDGKVLAVEHASLQQGDNAEAQLRTQAPADLAQQLPTRRNHGDLVSAARRVERLALKPLKVQ